MFPKLTSNYLQVGDTWSPPDHRMPHLIYANLNFRNGSRSRRARRLLDFVYDSDLSWEVSRTFRYLEEHQEEFRNCLGWVARNSFVDFEGVPGSEVYSWKLWREKPEVAFLQRHGLDHGVIALKSSWNNGDYFEGLALDQERAEDPLDPICWYVITLLARFGTIDVRRCKYSRCGKFFFPYTQRRLFCKDVCRARQHSLELFERDPEEFRRARAKDMRKYRTDRKLGDHRMSMRAPKK